MPCVGDGAGESRRPNLENRNEGVWDQRWVCVCVLGGRCVAGSASALAPFRLPCIRCGASDSFWCSGVRIVGHYSASHRVAVVACGFDVDVLQFHVANALCTGRET